MEYKVGQLTAFLNKTSTDGSPLKEDNNINKKKKKFKNFDQNEEIYETEKKKLIPSYENVIGKSPKENETKISSKKIKKNKKASDKSKSKEENSLEYNKDVSGRKRRLDLTETEDETNFQKFKKQKRTLISSEEHEENLSVNVQRSDQNRRIRKKRKYNSSEDEDKNKRTIFVGNLPITFKKEKIRTLFRSFGDIESIRIRSAAPIKPSLPKKVAVIKNLYHPEITSHNAYVVFKTEQMALDSLKLNGTKINNNHIRVDKANKTEQFDYRKSIFVGNLPYNIEDEELWNFFQKCGRIANVRVIRDSTTRIGKGFGYILFQSTGSANLALKMDGAELKGRPLRISRATRNENKKPQKIRNFTRKTAKDERFQGMIAPERQKIKKKKKIIKQRIQQKEKKKIAQKLQSKAKFS